VDKAEVVFHNRADKPDNLRADVVNGRDNLAYLLWYYELGAWNTSDRRCPLDAVLLSCVRGKSGCACDDHDTCQRDHTIWPPGRTC